ncbi:VF530 family protein [Thalassotalea sp. G2M2-11]|uniref:VF530 family protein n=1 Tax=Thalassotalea sp. G2M2-11 TaxID=2787627 RepID=UPI0019D1251D|nr:VF530 family protein [Thalassotalea sp. G2M2-11]
MNEKSIYENNPLHGLKLETLLEQLVSHYGWDILAEYTRINCFKNNPSMKSSIKFFKKTAWAREKIERFYLYEFKNLPKAPDDQFEIPPRERVIPAHQTPGEPKVLIPGNAPEPTIKGSFREDKKMKKPKNTVNQGQKPPTNPWENSPQ